MFDRVTCVLAILALLAAHAAAGTYSRSATTVSLRCDDTKRCTVVTVRSPDRSKEIRRTFNRDDRLNVPDVQVMTPDGRWDLNFDPLWVDVDIMWSPDSQYVALSGNPNGYMNSMRVFRISGSRPLEIDAAREPFKDMIQRFPPCRADRADPALCKEIGEHENDLNFAAADWTGEHTLVVLGEVPPAGQYGGILGQVMGYEVELPGGKIVRAMTAPEFKMRWQNSIPWKFIIPDPPEWQH